MSQSIADALHLHDADGYYVIFQEQRSGLWYIRSSVSVHREGFHILLRGYESQVFGIFVRLPIHTGITITCVSDCMGLDHVMTY